MQRPSLRVVAAAVISAALAQPVIGANLLTNGGFEDFLGVFPDGVTASNLAITTSPATWNKWFVGTNFKSVDESTLVDPTVPAPYDFPLGWGGNNFAQHYSTANDVTDNIKQGIDGANIIPGIPVKISFKYIQSEGGREVKLQVYGIDGDELWSQFAPWPCQYPQFSSPTESCTLLYEATIQTPYDAAPGWQTYSGAFTPAASHTVVAVGIWQGGHTGYARGIDDVVMTQNRPPVCTNATASTAALWPPDHRLVPISVQGVTDPDGDAVSITVTAIKQDEPVQGLGDGDTAPDGTGVGTSSAMVRAERAGVGNGRVYHISFTADDGNGGQCNGTVLVSVPKSQGKGGAAVDGGALFDSTTL